MCDKVVSFMSSGDDGAFEAIHVVKGITFLIVQIGALSSVDCVL